MARSKNTAEKLDLVRPMPTFASQLRHDQNAMSVLVVEEKHGTHYHLVANEAQLHAAALDVIKQRYEEGYFYGSAEDVEETKKDRAEKQVRYRALKAELEGLTNEHLIAAGKSELATLAEGFKYDTESIRHYEMAKKAVETSNGLLAWCLLESRSDYEYERVHIEPLYNVTQCCPRPSTPFHGQCWTDEKGERWVYDERTLKQWIPRVYAQVFYNVQKFQGVDPIVRLRDEADAYSKIPEGAKQGSDYDADDED